MVTTAIGRVLLAFVRGVTPRGLGFRDAAGWLITLVPGVAASHLTPDERVRTELAAYLSLSFNRRAREVTQLPPGAPEV
jgi:hypothetical protein